MLTILPACVSTYRPLTNCRLSASYILTLLNSTGRFASAERNFFAVAGAIAAIAASCAA